LKCVRPSLHTMSFINRYEKKKVKTNINFNSLECTTCLKFLASELTEQI
jgi:hypothetical protein